MATALSVTPEHRLPPPDDEIVEVYGEETSRGFDLRFVLAAIRRRLWWLLAILAFALAAGVLATVLASPRYTAQSSLQINDQSDRILGQGEDLGQVNNLYDTDRFLKTQIDVLQSRGLALRVAQKLKLIGNDEFYRAMLVEPPAPGTPNNLVREQAIGLLRGNLLIDLPYDSRIATVRFTAGEPEYAARIANTFATEFIQSNLQRRYDSSSYARDFIARQLADAKTRLESSERELNGYARNAGLIRTRDAAVDSGKSLGGGADSVTTASLLQLNQAANDARAARIAAEGRWRAVNGNGALNSREVLANGTVQALQAQRSTLQAKLQQERAAHLDEYPAVAELKAQLAETDRQLASAAGNVRASVRGDYAAAVAAERALEAQVNRLKGATLAEQDRSVQYNLLAREADTNRSLYDGLLQRYKELNAAAGVASSNVTIIDEAEAPLAPSSPNLVKNLAIALFLGFATAAALIFLSVQFDDAIRVPEDIEAKLGLPLLGVVPRSNADVIEALADPKSPVTEGYNALRATLLHSTAEGLPPVMLVTSAQAGEGKTTTSQAIGTLLARLGRRVLLVDGDMRRPSLHRLVGGRNERGLSTLLTSLDPLKSAVSATDEARLDVVTSGPLPPSPTELVSSNRFRALIDDMAEAYDVVIIDSPPILGLADAPAMSALVDGVVVVVESDRGRRGALKAALRRLRGMRPYLLGAVLTKFDTNLAANRYSEYYGRGHYEYETSATST